MTATPATNPSPPMRDSDCIFLVCKRLELIGQKMQRFEYDDELDRLMVEAGEWFEWMGANLIRRQEAPEPSEPVHTPAGTPVEQDTFRPRRGCLVIHLRHLLDGYPLCWPMDRDGKFVGSFDEAAVTCPDCRRYLEAEVLEP